MGRRVWFLARADRFESDGKPVGLQHHGGDHFDRRLLVVHLFCRPKVRPDAIADTVESASTSQSKWSAGAHSSQMTDLPHAPFDPLRTILGYIIAMFGVAMLI